MPGEDLHPSDLARSQAHSPGVHAWGSGTNDLCNLLQEVFLVLALAGHLVEDEEKAP